MKVIIAEKPSVARNIADAVHANKRRDGYFEGSDYLVTWAYGHLLELLDSKEYDSKMSTWRMENYPFIPEKFKYKVKSNSQNRTVVDEGAFKQVQIIKELIDREEVSGVISACDYDREGQIIGDIILAYLQVHKDTERLLLNEWTPAEVKAGLEHLRPNSKMEPLKDAGISRQWVDWVIGINLTSVATLKYQRGSGRPLNIGRVLLPTLKIIYDRDKEIERFNPEAFYRLFAEFKTKDGETYEGIYTLGNRDKFPEKDALQLISKAIKDKDGTVISKQVQKKKEYPPSLYNLSNLQGHVTSKYKGWTSDKVLKVAQSLYEKKFITYPRTSSMALEESLTSKAKKVLDVMKRGLSYEEEIEFVVNKRVFDNSKVESHSAIIPTYLRPKGLNSDENIVYEAIKNRFIMQFMPVAEHEEATIITKVNVDEAKGEFVSKGRIQLVKGWKKVEDIKSKDKTLPIVNKGDIVHTLKTKVDEKKTLPPKKHTEKTLLRVMETCGKKYKEGEQDAETVEAILSGFSIGTPATRAETIKKLESVGYIERKGKNLSATDKGKKLVEVFPVKELFDLEYTGRLEKALSEIEKGRLKKQEFLDEVFDFTKKAVEVIKEDDFHIINEIKEKGDRKQEVLGKCPVCNSDVVEGKMGYGCSNWRAGCKFVVWKNDKYLEALKVRPTKEVVIKLLENGKVYGNHFISKKGKRFEAYLYYEKDKDSDYFSWRMEFP